MGTRENPGDSGNRTENNGLPFLHRLDWGVTIERGDWHNALRLLRESTAESKSSKLDKKTTTNLGKKGAEKRCQKFVGGSQR